MLNLVLLLEDLISYLHACAQPTPIVTPPIMRNITALIRLSISVVLILPLCECYNVQHHSLLT